MAWNIDFQWTVVALKQIPDMQVDYYQKVYDLQFNTYL